MGNLGAIGRNMKVKTTKETKEYGGTLRDAAKPSKVAYRSATIRLQVFVFKAFISG